MADEDEQSILKMMVVGAANTGKSRFLERFATDKYSDNDYIPTVGIDFQKKNLEVKGRRINLNLWDAAGEERYQSVTKAYYRGSDAMIIAFDITNEESFAVVDKYLQLCKETVPEAKRLLLGCKCDLVGSRTVTMESAEDFARKNEIEYFETSAKNGTNVEEAIFSLLQGIVKPRPQSDASNPGPHSSNPGSHSSNPGPHFRPRSDPSSSGPKPKSVTTEHPTAIEENWIINFMKELKWALIVMLAVVALYVVNKYVL